MTEIDILQQENERLKNELKEIKASQQATHEDYKKKLSAARRDQALTYLFAGFETEFDDLSASVRDRALKEILNSRLSADGAEVTVEESGKLLLRKKDGSNFFGDDHKLLDPKSYVEKMMTRDKILKVASANPNATNTPASQQSNRNGANNGGRYNSIANLVDEALKAMEPLPA